MNLGFMGGQGFRAAPEVLGGLGGDVSEEFHLDAAGGDGPYGHVEEHHRVLRVRRPLVPLHRGRRGRRRRGTRGDGRSARRRHEEAREAGAGSFAKVRQSGRCRRRLPQPNW
jgi:hypothetical protein